MEDYTHSLKYDGCAEKVRENRTIEFQLPAADKSGGYVENIHPDLRHMLKVFSDSKENTLFKIEYKLEVFVKHLSKMEFGMGNKVTFPIQIYS